MGTLGHLSGVREDGDSGKQSSHPSLLFLQDQPESSESLWKIMIETVQGSPKVQDC